MATKKPLVVNTGTVTELETTDGLDLSGHASLAIPSAAGGKTISAAGQVCVDSTSKTLNYYDGAAEVVLQPVRTAAITIKDPDTSVDFVVFRTNYAITISEIEVVLRGSTPSITWSLMHNTDRNAAGNTIDSNTTTNSTTGDVHTTLTDATVPADSFIWLEISAKSGTVDEMHLSFDFTQDA